MRFYSRLLISLSLYFTVFLCLSINLYANLNSFSQEEKAAVKNLKISDYILTTDQLKQLTPEDQKAYFYIITQLVYVMEVSQNNHPQVMINFKTPRIADISKIKSSQSGGSEYQLVMRGRRPIDKLKFLGSARQKSVDALVKEFDQKINQLKKIPSSSKVEASFSLKKMWQTTSNYVSSLFRSFATQDLSHSVNAPQRGIASSASDTPGEALAGGYEHVKEGYPCIYGGYISVYMPTDKKGYFACNYPSNEKASSCGDKKNFYCHDYGLLDSVPGKSWSDTKSELLVLKQKLKKSLCVPLSNKKALTKRCSEKVNDWINNDAPIALSIPAYDRWAKNIKDHIIRYNKAAFRKISGGNDDQINKDYYKIYCKGKKVDSNDKAVQPSSGLKHVQSIECVSLKSMQDLLENLPYRVVKIILDLSKVPSFGTTGTGDTAR